MKRSLSWLDRLMLAVTFAEAGCPELAGDYASAGQVAGKRRGRQGADTCATVGGVGAISHAGTH